MTPRLGRSKSQASSPLLLVVVVDFLEVGVDDVVLRGLSPSGLAAFAGSLGRLVHGLAELHGGLHQVRGAGLDDFGILAGERLTERIHRGLDRPA